MIKRLYLFSLLSLFICASRVAMAQETKKVKQVKGEWVLSNDITPAQARENAINEAKAEALRQAGAPEIISSSNVLFHTEQSQMKELFESLTTTDVTGEISDLNVTREDKSINKDGSIVYQVWIDAKVILHKNPRDPGFGFDIKGIQDIYHSPDKLVFTIMPWKEGYITLFILSDKDGSQLYPNKMELQQKLNGQQNYSFPLSKGLDFEVSTDANSEVNYLLVLLTKDDIPFMQDGTPENVLRFVAGIDPSQKYVKTYSFLIKK
jgi:hypothetical protein